MLHASKKIFWRLKIGRDGFSGRMTSISCLGTVLMISWIFGLMRLRMSENPPTLFQRRIVTYMTEPTNFWSPNFLAVVQNLRKTVVGGTIVFDFRVQEDVDCYRLPPAHANAIQWTHWLYHVPFCREQDNSNKNVMEWLAVSFSGGTPIYVLSWCSIPLTKVSSKSSRIREDSDWGGRGIR